MLFAGVVLSAVGYVLVYCGVKGDRYQFRVGGKTVSGWQAPWMPFVAVFSRSSAIQVTRPDGVGTAAFYSQPDSPGASSASSASSPGGLSMQDIQNLPPAPAGQTYG